MLASEYLGAVVEPPTDSGTPVPITYTVRQVPWYQRYLVPMLAVGVAGIWGTGLVMYGRSTRGRS